MAQPAAFEFKDCALISLSVGKSVQNLRELRDRLAEVPGSSLWHHFFETLLRPAFDDPEYPNDFASWARRGLHDAVLAERLGVIEPLEFGDVEALRQGLLDVVEERLGEVGALQQATAGHELFFLRSQTVVLDTNLRARTPAELGQLVRRAPTGSIYYHFFDARRRSADRKDDFTTWLEMWGPPTTPIRERLQRARASHLSLTELRDRIARCFDAVERAEVRA